jgi:hypothetical protein
MRRLRTLHYILCTLIVVTACSWAVSDMPSLPDGPAPADKLLQAHEVLELDTRLETYAVKAVYQLEILDKQRKPITTEEGDVLMPVGDLTANIEVAVSGKMYRYKYEVPGLTVTEVYDGKRTWTLVQKEGKNPKGTINHDQNGVKFHIYPDLMMPAQEIRVAALPGFDARNIEFTHYVDGLDTTKYPAKDAYIRVDGNGWTMVFLDKGLHPIQIWWGPNHEPGHSFTDYSNWQNSSGRSYPAKTVEKFWKDGKWFSQVTVTLKEMTTTVDPKSFDGIVWPKGTKVMIDNQPESRYIVGEDR